MRARVRLPEGPPPHWDTPTAGSKLTHPLLSPPSAQGSLTTINVDALLFSKNGLQAISLTTGLAKWFQIPERFTVLQKTQGETANDSLRERCGIELHEASCFPFC